MLPLIGLPALIYLRSFGEICSLEATSSAMRERPDMY